MNQSYKPRQRFSASNAYFTTYKKYWLTTSSFNHTHRFSTTYNEGTWGPGDDAREHSEDVQLFTENSFKRQRPWQQGGRQRKVEQDRLTDLVRTAFESDNQMTATGICRYIADVEGVQISRYDERRVFKGLNTTYKRATFVAHEASSSRIINQRRAFAQSLASTITCYFWVGWGLTFTQSVLTHTHTLAWMP